MLRAALPCLSRPRSSAVLSKDHGDRSCWDGCDCGDRFWTKQASSERERWASASRSLQRPLSGERDVCNGSLCDVPTRLCHIQLRSRCTPMEWTGVSCIQKLATLAALKVRLSRARSWHAQSRSAAKCKLSLVIRALASVLSKTSGPKVVVFCPCRTASVAICREDIPTNGDCQRQQPVVPLKVSRQTAKCC